MITLPELDIDFNEEKHIYTLRGVRLPSVTQIMRPMSAMLYESVSEATLMEAADRGTRAHESVSNYVLYGVEEHDEDTEQYVQAFLQFQKDFKPTWVASEYRTYHKIMRYAGTIDLIGYIEPDNGTGIDVVDLKCTSVFHSTMLATQIGAYAEALKSHGIQIRNRYGLQLLKDGKYRFEKVEDGYKTFLCCMNIVNAMAQEMNP